MQIRNIRPEDRAEWIRMRDLLWPGSLADHQLDTEIFFTRNDRSTATLVVDRLDGRLGGFIDLNQRQYAEGCASSPVAYIEGWFIDADLRQKGLGASLVRAGEQWARDQGLQEIASDAEIENEISINAHKALGYKEEIRIVCFRKTLNNAD
jgi:aminoglycoside 6'-N-acetyltransferase I